MKNGIIRSAATIVVAFIVLNINLFGEETKHRFIAGCFSQGRICIIGTDGKIEWECKVGKQVQDAWMLTNGNILVSHESGVKEIDKDKKIVWEYKSPTTPKVQLYSVQPLPNGNVLACECGTKRLIEIDNTGKILKEIKLDTDHGTHLQFRSARKTSRGTYWVVFIGESKVKEIDKGGNILREITVIEGKKGAHAVVELPNGNVLASSAKAGGIKEFDKEGKLVWEITKEDLTKAGVKKTGYAAGLHRLSNGNTVLSVYHGNPQFLEVSPDKKIVWSYYNKDLGNVAGVNILDDKGDPAKGEVLR